MNLISYWKDKAKIANGRPFDASQDAHDVGLDAIWVAAMPLGESHSLKKHHEALSGFQIPSDEEHTKDTVVFPRGAYSPQQAGVLLLGKCIDDTAGSPFPRLYQELLKLTPKWRRNRKAVWGHCASEIQEAAQRIEEGRPVRAAVDDILRREIAIAEKEERKPDFNAPWITAEVVCADLKRTDRLADKNFRSWDSLSPVTIPLQRPSAGA